mgnify:CR=1 FL=1
MAHWRTMALVLLFGLAGAGAVPATGTEGIRIGLTPVFLDDQASFLKHWQAYLGRQLGVPVTFVQRQTYREISELLLEGRLDAAWTCGFPFVRHADDFRLLAVPLFQGAPYYRSYLIVPERDRDTTGWRDLKGAVFAYSDPDSNSGWLVPQVRLRELGHQPRRYFGRSFFTWSHRNVVQAVADGLAEAGAVDGYVWETLARVAPELQARTRVVARSERFGFPPLVAPKVLEPARFQRLRQALLGMADSEEGRRLLERLNLDGFVPGDPFWYQGIAANWRALEDADELARTQ